MNMDAYEQGSGLSVSWTHTVIIASSGAIIALAALVITISIIMMLRDTKHKFVYDIIFNIFGLVFIVALVFGVIGSM